MYKNQTLTPQVQHVLFNKGTESPFSGEYNQEARSGTYLCRSCGLALYRADAKFVSHCGWPSFDAEISGAVRRQLDVDGRRIEILCSRCSGHLGHAFEGEGYTEKNLRHCVNSLAVDFVRSETMVDAEEATVAGGCFWGVQFLFDQLPGVVKTEVGYTGGYKNYPNYHDVCEGSSGHVEAIRLVYDTAIVDYETIIRYFFEIHDPTQTDGQGPDKGFSYRSGIFYYDDVQQKIAEKLIRLLRQKKYDVVTELHPATIFWKAEQDHQDYYAKTGKKPYCHRRVKRWERM